MLIESINPNDSSGVKGRLALIHNLIKIGHEVKVLHLDQNYTEQPSFKTEVVKRYKTSKYYWLSKLNTFLKKFGIKLNQRVEAKLGFSFSHFEDVNRFKKSLQQEHPEAYDIVLTCSKAASFRPHKAVLESPRWHSKWYAYIHDPYPMYAYPRPYDWAEPGSLQKRAFFLELYAKAAKLVYPSELLAQWMESYYPNNEHKRLIIPHQITTHLKTNNHNTIKLPSFFDENNFNLLHAGSLMKQRPPFVLMKAFNKFLSNNSSAKENARLIFIGGAFEGHKNKMHVLKNDNIINHDAYIQFNIVFQLQKLASVNVVIEADTWLSPFLPGKIPHLVVANKPILHIGPTTSETMRLLGKNHELHTPNNEKSINCLAKKIEAMYKLWETEQELVLNRKDLENYLMNLSL
ncbi:hypothetical protein SAMN05444278_10793 [Psychroflexus salarius]|uniref:Uncharacterized protein n=2 Tax=Psychroflexus salarius TaxID=1155689 RepID=A0A1M4X3W5_9FLAO|nr:hypothetical protein SAMN05444278_10793 [Psychroflexus salarius]